MSEHSYGPNTHVAQSQFKMKCLLVSEKGFLHNGISYNATRLWTTVVRVSAVDHRREAGSAAISPRAAALPLSQIRVKFKQCWNIYNDVEEMICWWRGGEERKRTGLHAPPVSWHSRAALLCHRGCFCETRSASCIMFPSSLCHTHPSLLMLCKWI